MELALWVVTGVLAGVVLVKLFAQPIAHRLLRWRYRRRLKGGPSKGIRPGLREQ